MKNFKKLAYILLIVIIIVLGFVIYSISSSNNNDVREKTKSEISYFESKLTYMLNSLNNIEFENYKLSTEEIDYKSTDASKSEKENSNESSSDSSSDKSSEGESNSSGENTTEKTKKYFLNNGGVFNSKEEINWNYLKNEAEMLQNSISTMTLDLYEISLNNNDILNFSKEFDNLLIALKQENKEDSLKELTILYSYIPKFIKNCNADIQKEVVFSTKYSIFKAYSLLDSNSWDEILKYTQEAGNKFSKMLTNINIQNKNQYIVNKCYILINELQNSASMKDKEIFLIKYRNLLEDLNNL